MFLNRVYLKRSADPMDLHDVQSGSEVTMLSKNVERWIEEWKAEGKVEGKAEGEEKLRRVAMRLIESGMPLSQVAQITDLSEEELTKISSSTTH